MPIPTDPDLLQKIAKGDIPASQLVDALWELNRQKLALDENIAELERALIAKGAGKHTGDDTEHVLTVVAAAGGSAGKVFYALAVEDKDEAVAAAKTAEAEKKARDLAGEKFGNLFDRHVSYLPAEGFELIAPKLLTPAKARDLIDLCRRLGKGSSGRCAYITGLPKPAKK